MAVADPTTKRDWKKRESFSSALVQVVVVAAILAGAVYFIYQRGTRRREVADRLKAARVASLRDNPADLEKALAELDALQQSEPGSADASAVRADLELERWLVHKIPSAEQRAREALASAEAGNSNTEERYGAHAMLLLAEGKAAEASTFVEAQRQRGANKPRLWLAQGRAEQALGNLALARQAFAKAMDDGWRDPRFSTAYAEALIDEGQFALALDALGKALSANPDHLRARLDSALVQVYRKDQVKQATDTLKEVQGRTPELTAGLKARALAVQAEIANFEGKSEEAIKSADLAIAQSGDEYYALLARARALATKHDASAAAAFKAAVAKRPTAPLAYFDGAASLQAAGQGAAAVELLAAYEATFQNIKVLATDGKQIAALDRDDRYWLAKGDLLKVAGKPDEALASYDRAIKAESVNLVKAHYAKASVFLARKDFDRAEAELKPITPPDGSGGLGEAYGAMGDLLFAKKAFAEGCQNFAYALARWRAQQVPREKLNAALDDVSKKLLASGQAPLAKQWATEAKTVIQ